LRQKETGDLIKVNNLIKSFNGLRALDGVNMHVEKGHVYGLVGPNGAGKSTLIRHLTGVYRQDFGEVLIDGEPIYENRTKKAEIACIPDEPFYFLQADTMEMMHYYKGIFPSFDTTTFYRLQEFFPNIDMKCNIHRLSKGMQKQVAFWLSISCHPKLIILDEPLDGLDPVMRRQIWTILMAEVTEKKTTVLVTSHNLRELEDVCDHVGIMNEGKIMLERSLLELHDNISKLQVACRAGMPKLPKEFEILHMSNIGRVYTLIVKGNHREAAAAIRAEVEPAAVVDILPLSLEEIFIYEMGGLGYEVKDLLF
jgi:ABC-2 type transport system ATP-binding protein